MTPIARTATGAAALAVGMIGLGFAAVPLYDLFCRTTGFGGTTQRYDATAAAAVPVATRRVMSIRFDANVSKELPWMFKPERNTDTVSVGARDMMIFTAENRSSQPLKGTASFNVTPVAAGKYFTKIQCFCFTEQEIKAGQTVRMPVLYFVDPAILDDPDAREIEEITLSYTFHPVDADGPSG